MGVRVAHCRRSQDRSHTCSFARRVQSIQLVRQAHVIVTGSYPGTAFARIAGRAAVIIPGNTMKGWSQMLEYNHPAYEFHIPLPKDPAKAKVAYDAIKRCWRPSHPMNAAEHTPTAMATQVLRVLAQTDNLSYSMDPAWANLEERSLRNAGPANIIDCFAPLPRYADMEEVMAQEACVA